MTPRSPMKTLCFLSKNVNKDFNMIVLFFFFFFAAIVIKWLQRRLCFFSLLIWSQITVADWILYTKLRFLHKIGINISVWIKEATNIRLVFYHIIINLNSDQFIIPRDISFVSMFLALQLNMQHLFSYFFIYLIRRIIKGQNI